MIVKNIILDMLPSIWPMLLLITIIAVSLRLSYLLKGGKKAVIYKEILYLIFILYVLCLYYIVTYQDINYGGVNLTPFKEIFRYSIGSRKFFRNIIGNIVLFIPYGYFAAYFPHNKKMATVGFLTLLVSVSIEAIQYKIGRVFDIDDIILNTLGGIIGYLIFIVLDSIKNKLPRFMRSDAFLNFLMIAIIVVFIIYAYKIKIF